MMMIIILIELERTHRVSIILVETCKARFPLPELTGDRFPLPVNTGCVDGRVFSLAELTACQLS